VYKSIRVIVCRSCRIETLTWLQGTIGRYKNVRKSRMSVSCYYYSSAYVSFVMRCQKTEPVIMFKNKRKWHNVRHVDQLRSSIDHGLTGERRCQRTRPQGVTKQRWRCAAYAVNQAVLLQQQIWSHVFKLLFFFDLKRARWLLHENMPHRIFEKNKTLHTFRRRKKT